MYTYADGTLTWNEKRKHQTDFEKSCKLSVAMREYVKTGNSNRLILPKIRYKLNRDKFSTPGNVG